MISILFLLLFNPRCEAATPQIAPIKNFSFRIHDEPETLDWNRAHTSVEANLLNNLMEGLVAFEPPQDVKPVLAKSWKMSSDQKTYTYFLKPNIKWSDGAPLRAADFVYSWKRLLSPLTGSAYAFLLFDIEGAQAYYSTQLHDFSQVGIKALDDLTLEIRLTHPVVYWKYIPSFWSTFPLRQDIVEKQGLGWDAPGRMVTVGPYLPIIHDENSKWVLISNPNYHGQRKNINQITAYMIPSDTDALAAYQQGKLDVLTDVGTLDIAHDPKIKKSEKQIFPQLKTGFLGFAVQQYPISRLDVRRAIAMAINKDKLISILHGGQTAATSFVPPSLIGYSKEIGLPFNPRHAKAILDLSGIDFSDSSMVVEYLLPDWDQSKQIANFIQNELKQNLGIQVQLKPVENKNYRTQLSLYNFPLYDATWTADYPDPDNYASSFLPKAGSNFSNWKNAEYEQLVLQGRESSKKPEREQIYIKLQKLLQEEEIVIVPLYYEPNSALVHNWVKGFEINPLNVVYIKNISVQK